MSDLCALRVSVASLGYYWDMIYRAGEGFVLHESARSHFWNGEGQLSVKTFSGGRAYYDVGAGKFQVGDSSYLLLNQGNRYSITIDSRTPVESFCIFFDRRLTEEANRIFSESTESLLDDPFSANEPPFFVERTYPYEGQVSAKLFALKRSIAEFGADRNWLGEQLQTLLGSMFEARENISGEIARIRAVRTSTRLELYRRLHRARDFMAACFHEAIDIDRSARVACLSTNHFLRSFKEVFGKSPHQYLTELRMEEARALLKNTDMSITEICMAVGFESHGSFTALFRKRFGLAPREIRNERQPQRLKGTKFTKF